MTPNESIAETDARNAKELARLKWENSVLKKILQAGYPLIDDFANRKKHQPETAASN